MALPFSNNSARKPDRVLSIDLGSRTTKAVLIQRKGERFAMSGFAIQEEPADTVANEASLTARLKGICSTLGSSTKNATFALGINDTVLRNAELPLVSADDMRLMLKFNSKSYLQQDLTDHSFDCQIVNPDTATGDLTKPGSKVKVLVGGAKRELLDQLQAAARSAGLTAVLVTPSQIGTVNAFEAAQPEVFAKEVVALVDIGFKNSSICILNQGELALNRVVGIGADKLTHNLAETLSITYAEAESIKLGLPEEVQSAMQSLLMPLGRELRASIDFFEHQADRAITQVYLSGGSARSSFFVEALQSELMVQCKSWNPAAFLTLELPAQQMAEIEQASPQLGIAIGGALAAL